MGPSASIFLVASSSVDLILILFCVPANDSLTFQAVCLTAYCNIEKVNDFQIDILRFISSSFKQRLKSLHPLKISK